jgi:outer membrane protein OmpA-like peptidoglycan-associated protein/tetratricopeptide (TPR) repeat protein
MKKGLIILFVFGIAFQLSAQNIALSKADRMYKMYAYSEAVESYEKLLQRTPDNEYLIQQIAYCYQKMGSYQNALFYYEKHVQSKRARYEDFYQYALLLLSDEQFDQAIQEFSNCLEKNPDDPRPAAQIERINNFERLNLLHLVDTITNAPFNTRFADMSPAFFNDTIAYVSARDSSGKNTYSWNNQPFLDIYQFGVDKKGKSQIQKIPGINTKYHEGALVFTNDDQTVWFTRNNQKFSGGSGEQTNNLRIYEANLENNKWSKVKDFQYNSNIYSVGHPAFSPDGNTMYFASNMDTTYGETDLFKVHKIEKEGRKGKIITEWSTPENMGKQFNTAGKEMFPFVDSRGVIFFSSDGFIGFGGLDIYAAFPVADTFNVINLGQPVNSTYDDFSFIVSDDFSQGYLTSNRPSGIGSDDIYSFNIGLQHLFIDVKSLNNGQSIANAPVNYTVDGVKKLLGKTDDNGRIKLDVDFHKTYYYEISHPDFIYNNDSLNAYEIFKISNHIKTIYLDNASQLQILAISDENGDPVSDVTVKMNCSNGDNETFTTDANGKINHRLKNTGNILLSFEKEGYIPQEISVMVDQLGNGNFSATANMKAIYLGKTFALKNLYYDVNSSVIRPDAALVLDELYELLTELPKMKIELSSHTDCRATEKYNQWLSQKRAESAVTYLVSKGIDKKRMIAVGYGESKLLNKCSDGVDCSEKEHQINRRTEFKVLEF